ncbi:hypothetical protein ABZ478_37120 [Streptomyces sp. NPDC005706]
MRIVTVNGCKHLSGPRGDVYRQEEASLGQALEPVQPPVVVP